MIRLSLAGFCLFALILLVCGSISNALGDGGNLAEPRTWVYAYIGTFGQLGFTDKELGSLGPFAILALLCSTVLVYKLPIGCSKSCSNP